MELLLNLGTFTGLLAFVIMLTEWIKVKYNLKDTIWNLGLFKIYATRLISWVLSIGSGFAVHYAGLGWWAELPQWYHVLLAGFAMGLAANGIFSAEDIQKVLAWIFENMKKKPTVVVSVAILLFIPLLWQIVLAIIVIGLFVPMVLKLIRWAFGRTKKQVDKFKKPN